MTSVLKKVEKKFNITAFRYGGEEFLVLCNGQNLETLHEAAEDIRLGFYNRQFKIDEEQSVNFSVSLGVCKFGYSSKIMDITRMIDIADEALYFSKKNGKNRYTISSPDLQLYLKSIEPINKMITRFKRFKNQFILIKCEFELKEGFSKTAYSEFMNGVTNSFRVYDTIIFNYTGGFLCMLEDAIDAENIKSRLMESLKNHYSNNFEMEMLIFNHESSDIMPFFNLPSN